MPWCPNCKHEYRKGFLVCADCGATLVDEEPKEDSGTSAEAREISTSFLSGADVNAGLESIANAKVDGSEGAFVSDDEEAGDASTQDSVLAPQKAYWDSEERASENRSSAWILMGVGFAGIVLVILGILGLLPLHLGNPYLFYGVMGALFVLFFIAGVISIRNAKIFEKKAESENSLRSNLIAWCKENLTSETIDAEVKTAEDTQETLYFKRVQNIKQRLNNQFVNLDPNFLDQFIDEFVYESVFDEDELEEE